MDSRFDRASSHQTTTVFFKPWAVLGAVTLVLSGCAVGPLEITRVDDPPPPIVPLQAPSPVPPPAPFVTDEVDVLPPLPRFTTLADCESAYGADNCATGETVYVNAELAPPPGSGEWFIPFEFGVMTGVLTNRYFATPAPFRAGVEYGAFTDRVALYHYRTINRSQIDCYRQSPADVRARLVHSGPARFSPSRGVITGRLAGATVSSHARVAGNPPAAHGPIAEHPPGMHEPGVRAPALSQPGVRPSPVGRDHADGTPGHGAQLRPDPAFRGPEFRPQPLRRYEGTPRPAGNATARPEGHPATTNRSEIKR
jgi:hypothetical protein